MEKFVPHLKGRWFSGSIQERRETPLPFFTKLAAMGKISSFRAYWLRVYCLNHPDAIKQVFVDNAQNYWKGRFVRFLYPLLGQGLLTSEGDYWKRNRRLAQPAFHRDRLGMLVQQMAAGTTQMLDRWESSAEGASINLLPEMMGLTMSIVARTLFSADVTGNVKEVGGALSLGIEETNRRVLALNPFLSVLPTQRNREFKNAVETLNGVMMRIIEQHREAGLSSDLLSMLMEARDTETGEGLSDRQLRDECMTLFLAGHETTAVGLTWLWSLLTKHPEVEWRLRKEISEVLGDRTPTPTDLPKLKYTQMVWDETLRLYPPAWLVARESYAPDVIDGYPIPAKATLVVCSYALHRSPQFWDEPDRFDPERFSPDRNQGRPRHAYIPFGAGQRMCIGNNFANMEAQVIIPMMLQRFRIQVLDATNLEPEPLITLRPKGGVLARLYRPDRGETRVSA